MEDKFVWEIVYYGDYYLDFFDQQPQDVKEKFNWTLGLIASSMRIPSKYFRHLDGTDGLFEIRVVFESNIYRVFSFFDEGRLIVLLNGFQKKTERTPRKEIDMAVKLKGEYFDEKENN